MNEIIFGLAAVGLNLVWGLAAWWIRRRRERAALAPFLLPREPGPRLERSLRRAIRQSHGGRDFGWEVVQGGALLAVLTDGRAEDQFWDSYRVEWLCSDPELRQLMLTKDFWLTAEERGLAWINRRFRLEARFAFPALAPFTADGRLLMRALYLDPAQPARFK